MKKHEFQTICSKLKSGDIIILKIRAHNFLPLRENSFPPLAHCVFRSAEADFINVDFEGTINEGGALANGERLPNRVNYARIESIQKL